MSEKPTLSQSAIESMKDKYLTFLLGGEPYGLGIGFVTEIVGIQKIVKVPDMPDYVRGVINLRGVVIPVLDVRLRFGMPARDYDERTCVIVLDLGSSVGLLVDTVSEVRNIPAANVVDPPHAAGSGAGKYVMGLGRTADTTVILLDPFKMLKDGDAEKLLKAAGA